MSADDHYCVDFEPDDQGWWNARCECGWSQGTVYPTAEDAADALMDHAYRAGFADLLAASAGSTERKA